MVSFLVLFESSCGLEENFLIDASVILHDELLPIDSIESLAIIILEWTSFILQWLTFELNFIKGPPKTWERQVPISKVRKNISFVKEGCHFTWLVEIKKEPFVLGAWHRVNPLSVEIIIRLTGIIVHEHFQELFLTFDWERSFNQVVIVISSYLFLKVCSH